MDDLVVVEPTKKPAFLDLEPDAMLEKASILSKTLVGIITQQKLFSVISGRKYVAVEGWTTMGAMIGVLPRERSVKRLLPQTDGFDGYEAHVDLVRVTDGVTVGGGSALCTRDEKTWSNRDEFAVRSMAITRATGKAYRISFGWIIKLAGYEPTPAEEMPDAKPAKENDLG